MGAAEPLRAAAVENLGGWLTTVVARVCLNVLRSRETRREEPLAVHVPDPVVSSTLGADPEQEALLGDGGLSTALVSRSGSDLEVAGRRLGRRLDRHVHHDSLGWTGAADPHHVVDCVRRPAKDGLD